MKFEITSESTPQIVSSQGSEQGVHIIVNEEDEITSNGITFKAKEISDISTGNHIPHMIGLFSIFIGSNDTEISKVCSQININVASLILWGIMNKHIKSENISHFIDIGYITKEQLDNLEFLGFWCGGK